MMMLQQRAHEKLVSLSRVVGKVVKKQERRRKQERKERAGGRGALAQGGVVRGSNADVADSDGIVAAGDDVSLTREDAEAALTLLNLEGTKIEMEDVEAGLALLDLRAGTDTTLEEYLLTIGRG